MSFVLDCIRRALGVPFRRGIDTIQNWRYLILLTDSPNLGDTFGRKSSWHKGVEEWGGYNDTGYASVAKFTL